MGATPAGAITDYFGDLFEVLVHKKFASPTELRATKTVLTALLKWLQGEGIVDAATVAATIEDIKDRVDSYINIDTITFHDDYQELGVGPVSVPPEIAEMAETGWRILLSAHRVNGEWHLTQVVNGDPV